MENITNMNLSRRSLVAASAAAVAAGLGLTACGGGASQGSAAPAGAEGPSGTPANTDLASLPMPEKDGIYCNLKDRDEVQDGGSLVLPIGEIVANWNNNHVEGNTQEGKVIGAYYRNWDWMFYCDKTGSTWEANKDFIDSYKVEEKDGGKLVVTIDVNEKAQFNDGTPIDYRAWETVMTTMSGRNEGYAPASTEGYDLIESVVAGESDRQAVITFSKPYYPTEALVSSIMHPASAGVETFNSGWVDNPHNEWGCGPYVIDSFDTNSVVLTPNPKWWGNKPKLDSVTFKQMEGTAEMNAFKNGEVDASSMVSGTKEFLSNFTSMDNAEIRRGFGSYKGCLILNGTSENMSDIAVRKAFAQAVDPSTIMAIAFEGVNWQADPSGSIILGTWEYGYEDNRPADVRDLKTADDRKAAAKKTLEGAGYTLNDDGYYEKDGRVAGFAFTDFGDTNVVKNRDAAFVKMGKDVGLKVEIDLHPGSEFSTVVAGGSWDALTLSWGGSSTSYNNGGQLYGSDSESNYSHLGSKELDEAFASVMQISDHKKQLETVNEAEKKALELYGIIPTYTAPETYVVKKGLANYGPCLSMYIPVENIGWEK